MFWLALRVISDGNEGFNFDKKEYLDDLRLNVMRMFVLSRKYHNLKAFNEVVLKYIILRGGKRRFYKFF